jgi:hypothetical protein
MRNLPTPFTYKLTSDAGHAALRPLIKNQISRVMIDLGPDRRLNQINQFCFTASGPQGDFDVDLLIPEQARAQFPFRCKPQSIAGMAKMVTDSTDQTDFPFARSQPIAPGRTVGCTTVDGLQSRQTLQTMAHFVNGHQFTLLPQMPASDGHEFDKTHRQCFLNRPSCKVFQLVVVYAANNDHVNLDGIEPNPAGPLDPSQDALEMVSFGDFPELQGIQGIQTDIQAPESGGIQDWGHLFQQYAVGGEHHFFNTCHGDHLVDKSANAPAHQWFAAGKTKLAKSSFDGCSDNGQDFFIAEDLGMFEEPLNTTGHTVKATLVAPIGDGDSQIIDIG